MFFLGSHLLCISSHTNIPPSLLYVFSVIGHCLDLDLAELFSIALTYSGVPAWMHMQEQQTYF